MKQIISVIIILSIISPIWLTNTYVFLRKNQIKKQVKRMIISNIEINDLVSLKFKDNEIKSLLRWEHSKEFEYNGIMYDIVETKYQSDSIYYWCWEDREETSLNKTLSILVNKSFNDKLNSYYIKLSNLMSSLYPNNNSFDIKEPLPKKKERLEISKHNYSSIFQKPKTPPPKNTLIV